MGVTEFIRKYLQDHPSGATARELHDEAKLHHHITSTSNDLYKLICATCKSMTDRGELSKAGRPYIYTIAKE